MPRTLQQVYSRGCSLVCRHPDECAKSMAHVLVFVNCIQVAYKCWRIGSPELTTEKELLNGIRQRVLVYQL